MDPRPCVNHPKSQIVKSYLSLSSVSERGCSGAGVETKARRTRRVFTAAERMRHVLRDGYSWAEAAFEGARGKR